MRFKSRQYRRDDVVCDMKQFYLPLGLGFLVFTLLSDFTQAANEAEIKQIRQWYNQIQSDVSLKKTMINTGEDEEPHGVTLTRYENASGELKKLYLSSGSDHGADDVTYYYQEGSLFFIYSAYQSWSFTQGTTADGQTATIDRGGQSRYYFAGGKCVKALGKTVQTKEADKLTALLKKAENKPIAHHDVAPLYLKKSKMLAQVKNREGLEKFLSLGD